MRRRAEDIAKAIRFLAGRDSNWIIGQSFAIDGGHELRRNPDITDLMVQMYDQRAMDAVYKGVAAGIGPCVTAL